MISRTTEQQIRNEWQRKADHINQGVDGAINTQLDMQTVRLTLKAASDVGLTEFYHRVDAQGDMPYALALTITVMETLKELEE